MLFLETLLKRLFDADGMAKFRKTAMLNMAIGLVTYSIYRRSLLPDFSAELVVLMLINLAVVIMYIRIAGWFE